MSRTTDQEPGRTITGRSYSRKPRRTVMWADDLARRLITLSGIGSIVAVSLVGLFLVWVVLPLLLPSKVTADRVLPAVGPAADRDLVASAMDNYGIMAWGLTRGGTLIVRSLADGSVIERLPIAAGEAPTSRSLGVGTGMAALGFADGRTQIVELAWQTDFLEEAQVPDGMRALAIGETATWQNGLLVRTPEGQLRHQVLTLTPSAAVSVGECPVLLVDLANTPSGLVLAALDSSGVFHHRTLTMKTNLLTGKVTVRARGSELDLNGLQLGDPGGFSALRLNDTGDLALLIRQDGTAVRMARSGDEFAVSGLQDLVTDPEATLTAATFLTGRKSLAIGDSKGNLVVWFPAREEGGSAKVLTAGHHLRSGTAAVTSLAASARSRMLAAGYADGTVRVFNVTNERILGELKFGAMAVRTLTIAPREDQLLVGDEQGEGLWTIAAEYGEVSLATFFQPIWYEGYPAPTHVWQSSAGSDSFEPKLSLVPLIFGTLKATFYSLLFGLPLAFLAAIFTSEFLSKRARARVKPVIELMASLPSVVLGFLAALVVAPWVENVVVEVLSVMLLAPLCVFLGAHFWQLLPRPVSARLEPWRPVAILLSLAAGAALAWQAAPGLERLAFAGDFKAWLDGRVGSGLGGWFALLLVPTAAVVTWLNAQYGEGFIRSHGRGRSTFAIAAMDLGRFLAAVAVTAAAALFMGWLLNASGWDPRGSVFDTYVQRNALVVGIAMGFAIIPLIYTISEDALVSVPDNLRAASLGAGATPWQTAIRVVVPPAMSGLFSAAMIGLGRAVGETMIVLMAAGNTPIMEMNIFNGFRTLSANLAVELPEAVQNSTHYRTLFLAALTLFVMTFILNTVAEAVRLHFRGKTSRL
jgi:phosphate transport system permease protein